MSIAPKVATAPIRGSELRSLRSGWRVTVAAVSREMGVSYQRVSKIEATEYPTKAARTRYLEALTAARAAR